MKYIVAALVAWFLAVVGVSALPYMKILDVTPDLLLVFAASYAVLRPQDEAMIMVPVAGLMHDLTNGDPLGASMIGFAPLVILAAVIQIQAVETKFIPALVVVAIGTVTWGAIRMSVLTITGQEVQWLDATMRVVLPLAVVNTLFVPLTYVPLSWFSAAHRQGIMGRRRITSPL
ncbi:MAG TPA: rod shape-determining protein MreD [Dehalococcoidia bacterium]|nr:rod shape-determining protein MreD [Dehalococcoidia bacterium]